MGFQTQPPADGQLELFLPDINCQHCRKVVPQPFWVAKHFGRMTEQFPFCNETCSHEYYLKRMRESGAV